MNKLTIKNFPPLSFACSEAVNTLCTNLSFTGENVKKIMLTSCHSVEGKSFLAMNIMRTFAKLGRSVVLVDADLRRSMIESHYSLQFDRDHAPGLAHYLAGMVREEEVIYETNLSGAYMVPVGREVSNSLSLLVSPRFNELLKSLSKSADYVIVDAPPVGTIIDAAEISKSCDGSLIVVGYDAVRRQELVTVKEQLEQTGCPILGTVLNMVKFDDYLSKKYYYKSYYYHSYGYNSYYNHENASAQHRAKTKEKP